MDLGSIVKEMAIESKKRSLKKNDDFNEGALMAYYGVISLLKQLDLEDRFYFRYEDVFKDNKWKKEIDYEVVFLY